MRPRVWWRVWGAAFASFEPGDRVVVFHHIPCLECFYCRRKLYAQCPGIQESRCDGRIRTGGRRIFAVCAGDGLDRGARRGKNSGRRLVRARLLRRAGQYVPESRGAVRPAAAAKWCWWSGRDRSGCCSRCWCGARARASSRPTRLPAGGELSRRCGAEQALDPRTADVAAQQ